VSGLGAYEMLSPIGKGGVGEVYRAKDTKLDRDVAVQLDSEPVRGRLLVAPHSYFNAR
jgi:hypothetical protein